MDDPRIPEISIPAEVAAQLKHVADGGTLHVLSVRSGWAIAGDGTLRASTMLLLRRSNHDTITAVLPRP